jgi:hypothetical protein
MVTAELATVATGPWLPKASVSELASRLAETVPTLQPSRRSETWLLVPKVSDLAQPVAVPVKVKSSTLRPMVGSFN